MDCLGGPLSSIHIYPYKEEEQVHRREDTQRRRLQTDHGNMDCNDVATSQRTSTVPSS